MSTVLSGVTERDGKFVWGCPTCGQTSDEFDDREMARNSYRLHRRELCKGAGAAVEPAAAGTDEVPTQDGNEPDSTNAVEQTTGTDNSENSTMATAKKSVKKSPAKKAAAPPAAKKAAAKSPAKKAATKTAAKTAAKKETAAPKEKKARAARGQGEGKNRLRIFRLATVKNEKTGRDVTIRVKEDGTPRSAFSHLSAPTSWTEVEARSRKEAVKKFNDGEGTKRRASK